MFGLRRYIKPASIGIFFAIFCVFITRMTSDQNIAKLKALNQDDDETENVLPAILEDNEKYVNEKFVPPQKPKKIKKKTKKKKGKQPIVVVGNTHGITSTKSPVAPSKEFVKVDKGSGNDKTNSLDIQPKGWAYRGPDRLRCKVQTIGCFLPASEEEVLKKFSVVVHTTENMTDWYCVQLCSYRRKGKFVFAGIRNGNECRCSYAVRALVHVDETGNCNVDCAGDSSLKCGGQGGVTMVYHISSPCTAPADLPDIVDEESVLGCFERPKDLSSMMEEYVVEGKWSASRCLLQCESVGLILAVPTITNRCYCGFNTPEYKFDNPVDLSRCTTNFEDYVMVYRTMAEDKRCGKKRFLEEGELKRKVGLVTFPGSGNTWLRHLIESVTGIYTGSVYSDFTLQNGGYMGEIVPPNSTKIMVVKSHQQADIIKSKYMGAIINVYRNPYNALLSEFNRRGRGHTGSLDSERFNHEKFHSISTGAYVKKWHMTTKLALDTPLPTLIFSYENLVNNTVQYSEKMARFILGNDINEKDLSDRLLCLSLSNTGNFKRTKKPLGFDPYTKDSKIQINEQIEKLRSELQERGLEQMPDYIRPVEAR